MFASVIGLALLGCTTTGKFVIPPGTELEVYERPVTLAGDGSVTTKPFFWTAIGMPPGGAGGRDALLTSATRVYDPVAATTGPSIPSQGLAANQSILPLAVVRVGTIRPRGAHDACAGAVETTLNHGCTFG